MPDHADPAAVKMLRAFAVDRGILACPPGILLSRKAAQQTPGIGIDTAGGEGAAQRLVHRPVLMVGRPHLGEAGAIVLKDDEIQDVSVKQR